jgi:hypothetical protein
MTCSEDRAVPATRVLVFEPEGNGHQQEWLEHLVAHAARRPGLERLWIVAPAALCQALRPAAAKGCVE